MAVLDDLLALEEGFWRAAGSRDAYAAHLADDSVHVFPGWGVTSDNERVLQAVESVDPWESFEIEQPTLLELGDGQLLSSIPPRLIALVRTNTLRP